MSKRQGPDTEMSAGPSATSPVINGDDPERLLRAPQVRSALAFGMFIDVDILQKRFYRQRAHANVFVDHELD